MGRPDKLSTRPSPPPSAGERVNPFAFPAETNQRFTLLLLSGLMLTVSIGTIAFSTFYRFIVEPLLGGRLTDAQLDSLFTAGNLLTFLVLLPWIGLVTYLVYRRHPVALRRRHRLTPFDPASDPRFQRALERFALDAHLKPLPQVELSSGSLADGQAFGLPGRYRLRLGGRSRLLLRKRPRLFRAIVLHELAHIANGDVSRTYLTQALWRS
ncbi:MAG: hypothetical protein GYB68_19025, partial [Chloroflexi bacterium]|nr:hypothetical protein [Chloroflexota bacterium]